MVNLTLSSPVELHRGNCVHAVLTYVANSLNMSTDDFKYKTLLNYPLFCGSTHYNLTYKFLK